MTFINRYLIVGITLFLGLQSKSQGLIINEFSNGPSGTQEWIELLVIGDASSPLTPVNLTDWILDDNGGNFEGSTGGVGIASGHIKFGSSFNAVPPGSLIVVYYSGSKSANIPPDDPFDANNDSVYILPSDHSSLNGCSSVPAIGNFSYSCSPSSANSNYIGLRNGGDAIQVRTPLNDLYHGFAYGDVTAPYPLFPSSQSTWNIGSGAAGFAYPFDCGNWENQTSFNEINEAVSTPGNPNTTNNQNFIARLRNGSFDYNNLTANCSPIAPPPPLPDTTPQNPSIIIPNVFSPNEDQVHDLFVIDSLSYYTTKSLTIYNRWGNIVYEQLDYQNNWDGKNKNGKTLSDGTYYYILDIGENEKRVGNVTIFR